MKFWTSAKRLLIPAVILFSESLPGSSQPFTNINAQYNPNLGGFGQSSAVAADFNGDGNMDFLIEGNNGNAGYDPVLINAGNGIFNDVVDLNGDGLGAFNGTCAAADFYNVGRIDVLVSGSEPDSQGSLVPSTQLWRNMGGNIFMLITNAGLPGIQSGYVAVGDFENDGRSDLVLFGNGSSSATAQVFRSLPNGAFTNFSPGVNGNGNNALGGVFAADFDNDGYLDILLGKVLWRNLGNGVFTNISTGLPASASAVGDFNNDGNLDVLVANGDYQIWLNRGNGTFTNSNIILPSVSTPSGFFPPVAAVGDYDNDGRLDIVLTTGNYTSPLAQVWRNVGNGTFINTQSITGATAGSFAWGDFNGDSRLDFLMTGQQGMNFMGMGIYVTQVWQNNSGSPSNSPPTAPTNLTSLVMGNGVKMMWGAATDDHTPASGLNYNIRVGSSSGGVDIVSPEANPVTGQRLVMQIGNAQERLFSLLMNLSGGKYYWSVQAIDTAFAGGAFASEATFVIPPSISSRAYQSNGPFQVTFNALATNSYTLQASTNLTQWTNLTSVIPATNGPAQLTDSNTTAFPLRYYRVSSP